MKKTPQKKQHRKGSKTSGEKVLNLEGLDRNVTKHLDCMGTAYLRVSSHGADIAVQASGLYPHELDDSGSLWWPESGVRLDASEIKECYAVSDAERGYGLLECDFKGLSQGFSIAYVASDFRADLFDLITEAHSKDRLKPGTLKARRAECKPKFDACACCADRVERIKSDTEGHPITKILSSYVKTDTQLRFHIVSDYADLLCAWSIEELSIFTLGGITCAGEKHILHLDVSMIHTIQILNTTKEAVSYSTIRCYNSLGGVMIEISLEGNKHAIEWHEVILADGSDYNTVTDISRK